MTASKHLPGNTPVIVGVGQYSERIGEDTYKALSPMDLAGEALQAAIADCETTGQVAAQIDTLAAIRQFEISTPMAQAPFGKSDNSPRSIASRVGADPARAILEVTGGQAPQKLVGELASDIAAGRSNCAAIVGAEAISTMRALQTERQVEGQPDGAVPDWSEEIGGQLEDRGYGLENLVATTALTNGLIGPMPLYAMFETARRAKLGLDEETYRRKIGALFAPFTKVASRNPHAASRTVLSAEELATVTRDNRIVAQPYTRKTVSRDQVNQAAAIILCSADTARELGVPQSRWVHIHASVDAVDTSALARDDLAASATAADAFRRALGVAGITLADVDHLDLYSCYAIAVFDIIDALGIAPDDPRGLTLTGGLPFFGGPGNNYSTHAIAEAVAILRDAPHDYALVGTNGGYMNKCSVGVYSAQPADWSTGRQESLPAKRTRIEVLDTHDGPASIESYAVIPTRDHLALTVVACTAEGERVIAMAHPDDAETLRRFNETEAVGRVVRITPGERGRNHFTFAD
ncbi:Acetyl-CoA C-acetyltransferase [Alteripontixanthobacter maritimus]|uniref:Acetyl-CoA C-acetyltransferase n=1 Tax=Alteripontixanthobacter maritimus TaxID=2161824 RepID=A0A369Q3H3_9SPHN|nr:acetyl-CoA acetyltransferase [Alteripontixanthobacter maritimus]RDC59062.1 Acetyl-CoA C-acetyltransferase [Alteripontixanthobacter maritimus]